MPAALLAAVVTVSLHVPADTQPSWVRSQILAAGRVGPVTDLGAPSPWSPFGMEDRAELRAAYEAGIRTHPLVGAAGVPYILSTATHETGALRALQSAEIAPQAARGALREELRERRKAARRP